MNDPLSLKSYIKQRIIKQFIIGLVAMAAISVIATYFLGRFEMSVDLEQTASSTVKAFRSRILEGDVRLSEEQIGSLLHLKNGEQAYIVNPKLSRIYQPIGENKVSIQRCAPDGVACFSSQFGPAQILMPIYFDQNHHYLFGYLYLAKNVRFDWMFVSIVFAVFVLGYLTLLFGINNITKAWTQRLTQNLTDWAIRLEHNPKEQTPLSQAPFLELAPLKTAIEGLNSKIEKYESQASHDAKLLILRGIAHDILTPVAQLQLVFSAMEKMIEKGSDFRPLLGEIRSSLKTISQISSQVKTLRHLSDPPQSTIFSQSIVFEMENLKSMEEIRAKQIEIAISSEIKSQQNKSARTNLSKSDISRILQNLVQNAANASPPRSRIDIKLSEFNSHVSVSVIDQGDGIPHDLQNKVFEPDFTTKPGTGTGLGLSIVRHICQNKGGTVHLKSAQGLGTNVTVTMPIISSEGARDAI